MLPLCSVLSQITIITLCALVKWTFSSDYVEPVLIIGSTVCQCAWLTWHSPHCNSDLSRVKMTVSPSSMASRLQAKHIQV